MDSTLAGGACWIVYQNPFGRRVQPFCRNLSKLAGGARQPRQPVSGSVEALAWWRQWEQALALGKGRGQGGGRYRYRQQAHEEAEGLRQGQGLGQGQEQGGG